MLLKVFYDCVRKNLNILHSKNEIPKENQSFDFNLSEINCNGTKMKTLTLLLNKILYYFKNLFENSKTSNSVGKMFELTTNVIFNYQNCLQLHEKLLKNAKSYDCDSETEYNGYRTLIATFEKCCTLFLKVAKSIYEEKENFLFQMKLKYLNSTIKDYETFCLLIENFSLIFEIANEMQVITLKTKSLLIHGTLITKSIEEKFLLLTSTNQEAFFGRTCAFQFCDSLRLPLKTCAIAMISLSERKSVTSTGEKTIITARKAAKTLSISSKCMLLPEMRAQKLEIIMKNADIHFYKSFFQLLEKRCVQVGFIKKIIETEKSSILFIKLGADLMTPELTVIFAKQLTQNVLTIEKRDSLGTIKVNPPQNPVSIKLLSAKLQQGMVRFKII